MWSVQRSQALAATHAMSPRVWSRGCPWLWKLSRAERLGYGGLRQEGSWRSQVRGERMQGAVHVVGCLWYGFQQAEVWCACLLGQG